MPDKGPLADQFRDLFRETHRDVFAFAAWLTGGDQSWAEDITAETYMRAWTDRTRLNGRLNTALPWLLTIARNLFIDGYRKAQKVRSLDPEALDMEGSGRLSPEGEQIRKENHSELWTLLARLPVEHREVLVLRYKFDWRVKDIADHVGKSPNAVSATIRRSLSILSALWGSGLENKEVPDE